MYEKDKQNVKIRLAKSRFKRFNDGGSCHDHSH